MADSPLKNCDGDVWVSLYSEGAVLADSVQLISIEVTHAVNRIPAARIVIDDDSDTDPALRFKLSDADTLAPGKAIQVKAGYGSTQQVLFDGIVIRHGVRVGALGRGGVRRGSSSKP